MASGPTRLRRRSDQHNQQNYQTKNPLDSGRPSHGRRLRSEPLNERYGEVTTVILNTLVSAINYGRGCSVIVKLGGREFTAQNVFTGVVCIVAFLTAIANIGTSLYYLAVMPRLPEPLTGRIYPAGAAYNTAVYVNKSEFAWLNFLHYDMMSVVGISVVLFAIFVIMPKAQREGGL